MDALGQGGWGDGGVCGGAAVVAHQFDLPQRRSRRAACTPRRDRAAGWLVAASPAIALEACRRRWLHQRGGGSSVLQRPSLSRSVAVATTPIALSHLPLLLLALTLLCTTCVSPVLGAQAVTLSSRTEGDTRGGSRAVYPFPRDLRVTGGQAIFSFTVPPGAALDVHITTCDAVGFDSVLALLSADPFPQAVPNSTLAFNNNDRSCAVSSSRSSIDYRASAGDYWVVVSGVKAVEGSFVLTVRSALPTPTPLPWGLDRIDQRRLPLDSSYAIGKSGGRGGWVYVLDSGIRKDHVEFGSRAFYGYDFVDSKKEAEDCNGHGTHVAAIVGGTHLGVAPGVNVVSVRVLDCANEGDTSNVLRALEWVLLDVQRQGRIPAVVVMSLMADKSIAINAGVEQVVGFGIPVVVAAGNERADSCEYSPASAKGALTVGATLKTDERTANTNVGECTDIYAPGGGILSAWHTGAHAAHSLSGTSQAAPHVAGIVVLLLSLNERLLPNDVNQIILAISTLGAVSGLPPDSPTNRLAYVRALPPVSAENPSENEIFIYFVLKLANAPTCDDTNVVERSRVQLAEVLDTSAENIKVTCNQDRVSADSDSQVTYQVTTKERLASGLFKKVETALVADVGATQDALGTRFTVVEQAWVVDSRGYVYWAAPNFETTPDAKSLSAGQLAAIIAGAIVFMIIVVGVGVVWYRRHNKLDEVESMVGSLDEEPEPAEFDDYAGANPAGGGAGNNVMMRSFRNVVSALSRGTSRGPGGRGGGLGNSSFIGSRGAGLGNSSFIGPRGGGGGGGGGGGPNIDSVQVQSFGGEAFAAAIGMAGREESASSSNLPRNSSGRDTPVSGKYSSFRGWGSSQKSRSFIRRAGGALDAPTRSGDGPSSASSMSTAEARRAEGMPVHTHSVGGEVFATMTSGVLNVSGKFSGSESRPGVGAEAERGPGDMGSPSEITPVPSSGSGGTNGGGRAQPTADGRGGVPAVGVVPPRAAPPSVAASPTPVLPTRSVAGTSLFAGASSLASTNGATMTSFRAGGGGGETPARGADGETLLNPMNISTGDFQSMMRSGNASSAPGGGGGKAPIRSPGASAGAAPGQAAGAVRGGGGGSGTQRAGAGTAGSAEEDDGYERLQRELDAIRRARGT